MVACRLNGSSHTPSRGHESPISPTMKQIVEPMREERVSLSLLQAGGLRVGQQIEEVEVRISSSVDEGRRWEIQDTGFRSTLAKYQKKNTR